MQIRQAVQIRQVVQLRQDTQIRQAIQNKINQKIKIGHAGTLDPLAEGLLITCTGKKTKEIYKYQNLHKTYIGEMIIGVKTKSYDLETEIFEKKNYKKINDLIINKNCSKSLIRLHNKYKASIIASKKVKKKDVSRWGIFNTKRIDKKNFIIKDVVEKPSVRNAPSNFAVIGRYVLPKKIFKILQHQKPGKNGEIHITDSIRTLVLKGICFFIFFFGLKEIT